MSYHHRIPLHLEQEEHLVFGLSPRQLLILTAGSALAYTLFQQLAPASGGTLLLAILASGLLGSLFVVTAFVQIGRRGLEVWALVALLYISTPGRYLWAPDPDPDLLSLLSEAEEVLVNSETRPMSQEEELV